MEDVFMATARKKSPSTGLSYICTGNTTSPTRLFICFHGWSCAATDYARLFTAIEGLRLADDLYVAIDLPGHGNSPISMCSHPTVRGFAALTNKLRQELSPHDRLLETVLVGHSMGCRVVLEAFSQERTRVSGLIFLDGSWISVNLQPRATPLIPEAEIQRIIASFRAMYGPLTPGNFKLEVERTLANIDLDYKLELSRQYVEWDRTRMEVVLDEIRSFNGVKVLIVQSTQGRGTKRRPLVDGEEGPWITFVRSRVGVDILTSAIITGCGHWPHVDKADEVANTIADFANNLK